MVQALLQQVPQMRVWKLQGPWNDLAALHSLQRGISRFGGAASGHIYRCLSQEKSIILNAVHTYEGYSALWGCHQHDVSNKTGLSRQLALEYMQIDVQACRPKVLCTRHGRHYRQNGSLLQLCISLGWHELGYEKCHVDLAALLFA